MNSQISLFVLAAGMGSRYGGLKQMEGFGPNGETIIDYSIYDAVRAGFDNVIFVIRPEMEEAFKEIFMKKYLGKINIDYVFQSIDMLPDWYQLDIVREKPWGTGHALLCAKEKLKEPFLVINGDDFYGKEPFEIAVKFLKEECDETTFAIPAYRLENVLSEYGTVKRGVCTVEGEYLKGIQETFEIKREGNGTISGTTWDGKHVVLRDSDLISMNLFCLHDSVFSNLQRRFEDFLKTNTDVLKGEYLLPVVFNSMIEEGEIQFKVFETKAEWFGVTVKEDAEVVRKKIHELVDSGEYPLDLKI